MVIECFPETWVKLCWSHHDSITGLAGASTEGFDVGDQGLEAVCFVSAEMPDAAKLATGGGQCRQGHEGGRKFARMAEVKIYSGKLASSRDSVASLNRDDPGRAGD